MCVIQFKPCMQGVFLAAVKEEAHNQKSTPTPIMYSRSFFFNLGRRVKAGKRIVEHQELVFEVQCSSKRNPLLLTAGQKSAIGPNNCLVAIGKRDQVFLKSCDFQYVLIVSTPDRS